MAQGALKKLLVADLLCEPFLQSSLMIVAADPSGTPGIRVAELLGAFGFSIISISRATRTWRLERLVSSVIRYLNIFNWRSSPGIARIWSRWRMSLSRIAFRDLFFPVAVKSHSDFVAFFVTMCFIGVWHAASAGCLFWALHHAAGLSVLTLGERWLGRAGRPWRDRAHRCALASPSPTSPWARPSRSSPILALVSIAIFGRLRP